MPKRPATANHSTKKVFLSVPDDYYEMSDAEQLEVCGQMADIFIRELGMNDAKPKRKSHTKRRQHPPDVSRS